MHFYDPREWRPLTEAALLLGNRGRGRLPLFYDEGRDELDRCVAGIDAKMNFAGFNIECLACPVSGCGAPFVFKHQRSFQNISDQRTGMGVSEFARPGRKFQCVHDGLETGRPIFCQ